MDGVKLKKSEGTYWILRNQVLLFVSELQKTKNLNHFSIDDLKCVFLQVNSLWAMHLLVEKKNITLVVHVKNFTFPRVLTLPCMG